MANTIKRKNDPALSERDALAGWKVSPADVGRALAKWGKRLPGFERRLGQERNAGNRS